MIGATGFVGRALVPALAQRGEVIAVSRRGTAPDLPGVRALAADVTDSLRGALEGVDVAYHLVHSLGSRDFSELDRRAAENVAAEAERAGVSQIVYLGGLGEDQPHLSAHLRSRMETAAVLASGAVPVTTLRAAVIVGRGSAAFETIVALVDRLPVMVAPRWLSTPTQPIALDDMIRYLDGRRGPPGGARRELRRRRPGGPHLRRHGQAHRPHPRTAAAHPRGAGADPATVLVLAAPRHARPRRRRPPAHRGPAKPDGGARRPHPAPAPVPPHGFCDAARRALDPVAADQPENGGSLRNRTRHFARTRSMNLFAVPAGRTAKWVVFFVTLVVFAGFASQGGKFEQAQKNETSSFLPGSAESVKALKQIERFPGGEEAPAVIVYERPSGLTGADKRRIQETVGKLNADRRRAGRRGAAAGLLAQRQGGDRRPAGRARRRPERPFQDAVQSIRDRAGGSDGGLQVKVTGAAGYSLDAIKVFGNINGSLLLVAALIVLILLIVIYRSPIFWIIPFFTVLLAEGASRGLGYLLAEAGVTINGQSGGILPVLVFGAGTDYALLLVSRYREELRRHEDKHEAMAIALRSAGPAILASGLTVIAALLTLSVAEVNGTAGLGPIGAMGVALAMISMLTMLPAALTICGRKWFWPRIPHLGEAGVDETHGFWRRIGDRVARPPARGLDHRLDRAARSSPPTCSTSTRGSPAATRSAARSTRSRGRRSSRATSRPAPRRRPTSSCPTAGARRRWRTRWPRARTS